MDYNNNQFFMEAKSKINTSIKNILDKHLMWLNGEVGGERADLSGKDLSRINLFGVNLSKANLSNARLYKTDLREANLFMADLYSADLSWANLSEANLQRANLRIADLHSADLSWANLSCANFYRADLCRATLYRTRLREANLYQADLYKANLSEADLHEANLSGANLRETDLFRTRGLPPLVCPEFGSFVGWKKCANDKIVKLEICEDALRSSATTRKCRCSAAKVLEVQYLNGTIDKTGVAISMNDERFIYRVGEIVKPTNNFNLDRWNECSTGIHFFITRQEAVEY